MDSGVAACDLRKVGERICRGSEEEPGHIDTEDSEEDLDSNHFVVNDRCCCYRGRLRVSTFGRLWFGMAAPIEKVERCGLWLGIVRFLQT